MQGESEAGSSSSPLHGFAAGVVAGASGVLVGHAFDTAKVRQQVTAREAGVGNAFAGRWSLGLMYRGIVPPLITTGAVRSLYFGTYETLRPAVAQRLRTDENSRAAVFIAGCLTGGFIAPVTAPMQRLKLMQQVEGGSLVECTRKLLASPSGALGFFRGLPCHLVLETLGSGSYLLSYHAAKAYAAERAAERAAELAYEAERRHGAVSAAGVPTSASPTREPLLVRIACGALAGCIGWLSICECPGLEPSPSPTPSPSPSP